MAYNINEVVVADTNPVAPVDAGPMAPKKPFLNNGRDEIAVYPEGGSMADKVVVMPHDWDILPPEWSNVKIRTNGETNVFLSCKFTTAE